MSVFSQDASLQVFGIGALQKHIAVVIAFDNQKIGQLDKAGRCTADMAQIGNYGNFSLAAGNIVAQGFRSIMQHPKRLYRKPDKVKFFFHLNMAYAIAANLPLFIASQNMPPNGFGGIDGNMVFFAQGLQSRNMVVVVVGNHNAHNLPDGLPNVLQVFFDGQGTNSGINQQAFFLVPQIVAIATASAAQAAKMKCFQMKFSAKIRVIGFMQCPIGMEFLP